ncbi:MAG: alpha/beta hydrolase [Chloroherpetonaceae bacterium]
MSLEDKIEQVSGKEKIKGSKLIMLPQTGHMLIVERPKELANEIATFAK